MEKPILVLSAINSPTQTVNNHTGNVIPLPLTHLQIASKEKRILSQEIAELKKKVSNLQEILTDTIRKVSFVTNSAIHFVNICDIVSIEADGNYSLVTLNNDKNILVSQTLKKVIISLNHSQFIRVHQSYCINKYCIKEYYKKEQKLILDNGKTYPISRKHKDLINLII